MLDGNWKWGQVRTHFQNIYRELQQNDGWCQGQWVHYLLFRCKPQSKVMHIFWKQFCSHAIRGNELTLMIYRWQVYLSTKSNNYKNKVKIKYNERYLPLFELLFFLFGWNAYNTYSFSSSHDDWSKA